MLKYPVPPASYTMLASSSTCLSWIDFPTGSNVIKEHAFHIHDLILLPGLILWKYTMLVYLWLDIPFLRDWVPSINYRMFTSSSLCLSRSWLDFPPSPILWKHTRSQCSWSNITMPKDPVNKVRNVHIFEFGSFKFMTLFSREFNIIKVHHVSWKYKVSMFLWLNIPFMKDRVPSIWYTIFTPYSLCLSFSRLDFPAGSNVMKVHQVSVFMTQYSKADRLRSIDKLQNVSIFQFVFFMFMTLFSHESNMMKVHKFTLCVNWYSILKDWASSRT